MSKTALSPVRGQEARGRGSLPVSGGVRPGARVSGTLETGFPPILRRFASGQASLVEMATVGVPSPLRQRGSVLRVHAGRHHSGPRRRDNCTAKTSQGGLPGGGIGWPVGTVLPTKQIGAGECSQRPRRARSGIPHPPATFPSSPRMVVGLFVQGDTNRCRTETCQSRSATAGMPVGGA